MKRSLLVGILLLPGIPGVARGQYSQQFFDNYCISSFNVCASVRLFSSGNTLTMQMWNMNGVHGVEHTMTAIGLYHAGPTAWTGTVQGFSAKYVTATGTQDITTYWRPNWATSLDAIGLESVELARGTLGPTWTSGGVVGCTDPGGGIHFSTCNTFPGLPTVEFTFNLSSYFDVAGVDLRWQSNGAPTNSLRAVKCDTGQPTQYGPCAVVTPEPVTIALLGSGLAGLGGAGLLRRRRKTLPQV